MAATDRRSIRLPLALGIVIPILCFVADPGLFRPGWFSISLDLPPLQVIAVFAYAVLLLVATAVAVDLAREPRSPLLAGVLAGAFVIAIGLGLLLLPFSALGLFFYGIGLLGLLPFLSAWSYWRRARAAWRRSAGLTTAPRRIALAILGLVLVCGLPAFAQWTVTGFVHRTVADIRGGDQSGPGRLARLRPIGGIVNAIPIVLAHQREPDATVRLGLETAYNALTGGHLKEVQLD